MLVAGAPKGPNDAIRMSLTAGPKGVSRGGRLALAAPSRCRLMSQIIPNGCGDLLHRARCLARDGTRRRPATGTMRNQGMDRRRLVGTQNPFETGEARWQPQKAVP